MNAGKYIFSQIVEFMPKRYFERLVCESEDKTKCWRFSYWNQLLVLIFAQLDGCRSLRELADIVKAHKAKAYHLGFGATPPDKSMLSRANTLRQPKIFEDFAFKMMRLAEQVGIPRDFVLHGKYYAFDSTTIDLCMNLFEWAKFRSTKSGVKVHLMFDITLQIPSFFRITNANVHDVNAMDEIPYEPNACYIFDRGYYDLERLYHINKIGAFFVIREKGKPKFDFELGEDLLDGTCSQNCNVIADQIVFFTTARNSENYPARVRRVLYYVEELHRTFVYYTNNFFISAENVALLYKNRWQVETFFKWIKQHLRVTSFWGNSENAVRIQVCVAIATFCLMHIIKHKLGIERSTYEVMRILGSSLLAKDDIRDLFFHENKADETVDDGQLWLKFAD